MLYQYKREPLTADEANRLASACTSREETHLSPEHVIEEFEAKW